VNTDDLRADWLRLCVDLGMDPTAASAAFDQLADAYASPGRAYHVLAHVGQVLRVLVPLSGQARDFVAVQFAAWFHDAVYDPRAADNEERSAAFAAAALRSLGLAEERIAEVGRLILLTKTHDPAETDSDGRLLVDADLAILAATPAEYQHYAAAIRQEYAWVPDEAYRSGRRAVLQKFLQRPRLYRTAALARWEEAARRNLTAEVATLL
jgi:predicted metal-dependent HD superfamily phosphohydrolase